MKLLIAAIAFTALCGCQPRSTSIVAQELRLVDNKGQTLILLSAKNGLAEIGAYSGTQKDVQGKPVSRFIVTDTAKGEPVMFLQHQSGKKAMLFWDDKRAEWALMAGTSYASSVEPLADEPGQSRQGP